MITGFFPGRIRLRSPIFKNQAIAGRAISILTQFPPVTFTEHTPSTGSILVKYDVAQLPTENLQRLLPFFKKLEKAADTYSGNDNQPILDILDEFESCLKNLEDA
ncbi:HMA2 domain-containing protein [Treponema sp.]|uniref:HMA2 domain-containing protein n=1 Tax=Treponema sp. TaxID=166 RepID=UPI003FA21B03